MKWALTTIVLSIMYYNFCLSQGCPPSRIADVNYPGVYGNKDPDDIVGYCKRANEKYKQNNFIGAIADYSKAIGLNPDEPEIYINRGSAKAMAEDYYGAVADFNQAIKLNPKSARAYSNRGWVKSKLNDPEGAIEDCNNAITLDPANGYAYYNLGMAWLLKGKKTEACSALSKAGELGFTKAYTSIKQYCH